MGERGGREEREGRATRRDEGLMECTAIEALAGI